MTKSAVDVEFDFPREFLLKYFEEDYDNISDYATPDYMKKEQPHLGDTIVGFKVDCHNYFEESLRMIGDAFCDHFGIEQEFVTHFLCVEPGHTVDWHVDGGDVVCAINVLLRGDPIPVEFEDGQHTYDIALLNVKEKHRVINNSNKQRVLFRLSFMDGTYEDIKSKCQK